MVASMGVFRSLLLVMSLVAFLVLALVTNISAWSLSTLLDSDTFAATASRIVADPPVRLLLADRLAEQLTSLVAPVADKIPAEVPRALGLPSDATQADVRQALTRALETTLADPVVMVIEQDALEGLHGLVMGIISSSAEASDPEAVTLDLTGAVSALGHRLDPDSHGFLDHEIPAGLGTVTLVRSNALPIVASFIRVLETIRWLLPVLFALAGVAVLALARGRLHAVAWLGLVLVVVGAACLMVASGAPAIAARMFGSQPDTVEALEATLEGLTADLVTQSAVLAGVGLAMLVMGITAGIVTGRGDDGRGLDGYR